MEYFNYYNKVNDSNAVYDAVQNPLIIHLSKINQETETLAPLHTHKHIEIFYILSGEGYLWTQSARHPIGADTLIVVDSDTPHTEQSATPENALCSYAFSLDNIYTYDKSKANMLPDKYNGIFIHKFDNADNEPLRLFLAAHQEFAAKADGYHIKVKAIVISLAVEILRILKFAPMIDSALPVLLQTKLYIDEHFSDSISLDDLAQRFFTSRFHISREFKKAYGVTITQYHTSKRIEHAKFLLKSSDKTVNEISKIVGYDSPVYFTKIFKSIAKVPPLRYRNYNHFSKEHPQ